jgi:TDG/mug DNA glycosylase family protein
MTSRSAKGRPARRPDRRAEGNNITSQVISSDLPLLRDRISRGVVVLFVGINPGVRSALMGHHFAGYSNRFWKLLYESGLVPEPIGPEADCRLPVWGFGITNIVARPTPGIGTLRPAEYVAGRTTLRRKVRRHAPLIVAMIGVTVFRAMFPERKGRVAPGMQEETLGRSAVFVLPNPSGRNAHFTYAEMLASYRSLAREISSRRKGRQ